MAGDLRDQLQTTLSGSYTIERELGGGGMSKVFVAEELRLKRKVVVKVLSPELAQGISVDRFEREIQTVAALQHANIVPVHTAGDTNGLPFYTMPFVEGESLRARLGHGPLPVGEVIGIMRDVSKALAYAHQRGVVHRDIKPDNVLISGGVAVVTDFGIAKAISASRTASGSATLTQIGTSIGTPAYMAPEQAAGDPNIDHRADIYALGAMAYELLSGEAVFAGRTPQRMLAAHMGEAPKPITELRGDLPQPLADLVMQCLAKEASDRPQNASDIARVLETITSGSGMQAMPPVLLGGPAMFRKALAIYAGAFVVVAVLAKAAIVGIGLPEWVFAGSLIVMALGLPVVLWTGYVQRVTRRAMMMTPTFTPGGSPSLTHGTIATIALKAAPHVSWYKTARGGMYAFGAFIALIAAFMAMRAFGVGPFGSLMASGRLKTREPILLTDFRTTNTDLTLGRVVSDAVRAGLNGSSAFTLTSPTAIVAALNRMKLAPTTRVDSAIAREIAVRDGIKAYVDGDVTGVAGGYIVSIRLVRADSGIELASFRETGDGPRGLIDAADRLARALRSKAGESLRSVNATPPLFRTTTSSLPALRKYSEAVRLNSMANDSAVILLREAVAIDSNFASAWSTLGAFLGNYGGSRSAIDSAVTRAYRLRNPLTAEERDRMTATYFGLGPGRDRAKAIAAYEAIIARGDSGSVLVNLGERLRTRREYARAESLNLASFKRSKTGTSMANAIEMQINQGKVKDAVASLELLKATAPDYAGFRIPFVLYAAGGANQALRSALDSLRKVKSLRVRNNATYGAAAVALLDGRLRERDALLREIPETAPGFLQTEPLEAVALQAALTGPSAQLSARLDAAIAQIPFKDMAVVDRPYLDAGYALARAGNAAKARAMLARYKAEVTDTAYLRSKAAEVHAVLGEIALAEQRPQDALTEFRLSDVSYDGKPADECAACVPFDLARAFDAAGQSDSAAVMFERYLSTPYWLKAIPSLDMVRLPAIHERLGQIYESKGNTDKAVEHYRAFIELWKNADPELQPRVTAAKERLKKLTPVERPKH